MSSKHKIPGGFAPKKDTKWNGNAKNM